MIKGQRELLGEALFYSDIFLLKDSDFEVNLIVIFECNKESTLQHSIYHVIWNLMYFSRTCLLVCIHYVMQSISRHDASPTTNTLH